MLFGNFQHAIDEKGRTSLPVDFRAVLVPHADDRVILSPGASASDDAEKVCLWCQKPSVWEEMTKKIETLPGKRKLLRHIVQQAVPCGLDKQGRILVPQHLRDLAGFKEQIIWAGAANRVEIWDLGAWNSMQTSLRKDPSVMAAFEEL